MAERLGGGPLTIQEVSKTFGDVVAVDRVSIEVPEEAFLVLLGPSGCGKTTLLRLLAGLDSPTAGSIRLGEEVFSSPTRTLPPEARSVGLVFQSYALWPHMTVRKNIEWPLSVAGLSKPDRQARAEEVLQMLELDGLGDRYPSEISGGQQQRVAVARMLGPRPSLLLFDEPLSNLDAKLRVEMRAEILRVHQMTGATSVYVTHDQAEALTMATHLAVLESGRVQQLGPPSELLDNPANPFVASFLGTPPANLLSASTEGSELVFEGVSMAGAAGPALAHPILMYRPRDLALSDSPGTVPSIPATAVEITPLAGRYVVTCVTDGGARINVVTTADVRRGSNLHIQFPPNPASVFEGAS